MIQKDIFCIEENGPVRVFEPKPKGIVYEKGLI
jgi:hypothetical protein